MIRPWELPSGMTLEAWDQYIHEREKERRRECYARHPDRAIRQRLTCAANLLNRHGFIDDQRRDAILAAVKAVNLE